MNYSRLQTKVMVQQQQDTASCMISVIYNQSTGCWLCYTFHCILLHSALYKQCTVSYQSHDNMMRFTKLATQTYNSRF